MKKILISLLSSLLLAGLATTASADWVEGVDYVILADSMDPSYAKSTETLPVPAKGELLTGAVYATINSKGEHCLGENSALNMFDGSNATYFESWDGSYIAHGGIILDQAYELTEVRALPCPELEPGSMFFFTVQGSNDGIHWVNIVQRIQDAMGQEYQIYTPQTPDYGDIITTRTDDSIFWEGKGGAYRMYRISGGTPAEVEFYGIPGEPTETTAESVSVMNIGTLYYFPGNIHIRKNAEIADVEGNMKGTVIGAGGAWNKAIYDYAFDNNGKKIFDPPLEGQDCWVGMLMDEPYALTEVRILPKRGAYGNVANSYIQGSLDGVSWVTLAEFTEADVPKKQEWVTKTISDTAGYTYFRYISGIELQSCIADLLFYGAPAAAAEVTPAEPLIATETKFSGELDFLDIISAGYEGSVTGQVFGYQFGWRDRDCGYEYAWDGNLELGYGNLPRLQGWDYFTGIKTDEAVVPAQVRVNKEPVVVTHYFQGSNDGENWTTIVTFGCDDARTTDGWYVKDIAESDAYTYFRFVNNGDTGNGALEIAIYTADTIPAGELVYETEEPETAAPETTAPETAAPETAAPETAAPETSAPETSAPETSAPETAAPETSAPETSAPETSAPETNAPAETPDEGGVNPGVIIGIAAAVVVVVGVAIVIIKKRK